MNHNETTSLFAPELGGGHPYDVGRQSANADFEARMIAMCVGTALLFIRDWTADPEERFAIARRMGEQMAQLVNDPTWGANHSGPK